jgi:hypothetical protein
MSRFTSLPLTPVLSYTDSIHTFLSYFSVLLPSTTRSFIWTLSLTSPHQNAIYISLLPKHATCSAHPWFHYPHSIQWQLKIMRSVLCDFTQSPVTSSAWCPSDIFLSFLFSYTLSVCSSVNLRDQISYACKMWSYSSVWCLYSLIANGRTKDTGPHSSMHFLHF